MPEDYAELREKLIELGFKQIEANTSKADFWAAGVIAEAIVKPDDRPAAYAPPIELDQPCFAQVDIGPMLEGKILTVAWIGDEYWSLISGEPADLEPLGFVAIFEDRQVH